MCRGYAELHKNVEVCLVVLSSFSNDRLAPQPLQYACVGGLRVRWLHRVRVEQLQLVHVRSLALRCLLAVSALRCSAVSQARRRSSGQIEYTDLLAEAKRRDGVGGVGTGLMPASNNDTDTTAMEFCI